MTTLILKEKPDGSWRCHRKGRKKLTLERGGNRTEALAIWLEVHGENIGVKIVEKPCSRLEISWKRFRNNLTKLKERRIMKAIQSAMEEKADDC